MMKKHKGVSVVEFLVVLLIASLMMAMLFRSYQSIRHYYEHYTRRLMLQKEKLLLSQYLLDLTAKAGHCGLLPISKLSIKRKPTSLTIHSYQIFDKSTVNLPRAIKRSIKSGTKGLEVSYVDYLSSLAHALNSDRRIHVLKPISVKRNQRLVICGEHNLEFLPMTKNIRHRKTFYTDSPTVGSYHAGATVGIYRQVYIYIKKAQGYDALYWAYESGLKGEISHRWQQLSVAIIPGVSYPIAKLTLANQEKKSFSVYAGLFNENNE